MRGEERERSNTQPAVATSEVVNGNDPAQLSDSPSIVHQPRPVHASEKPSIEIETPRHTSSPTPLIIPTRIESLPSSSSPSTANESPYQGSTKPLNFGSKQTSSESGGSNKSSPVNNLNLPTINAPSNIPLQETVQIKQAVPGDSMLGSGLTPNYGPQNARYPVSRESRISLPDEAKRYIATMGESPLQSPKHNGPSPDPSQPTVENHPKLAQVHEEVERAQDGSPRPFLELDDDESENDRGASDDMRQERVTPDSDSELDPERNQDMMAEFGYQRKRSEPPVDQMHTPRVRIPGATADQFPLPPSTTIVNPFRGPSSPVSVNGFSFPPQVAVSSSLNSTTTLASTNEAVPEQGKRDSFMPPSIQPVAKFRQMPLLDTDIQHATVEVMGSHIRPNDKGKEVLCFVIGVNVVGKDGWTVC